MYLNLSRKPLSNVVKDFRMRFLQFAWLRKRLKKLDGMMLVV